MKIWVNADDFGWNESCTKAIMEAFRSKMITTTTACVNGEYFEEAVELIKNTPHASCVGIHFNLTEGKPLSSRIAKNKKFCIDGNFTGAFSRNKPLTKRDRQDVYEELSMQAKRYIEAGLSVNHVDSHHHVHNAIFIFPIFLKVCKENSLYKVRLFRNIGPINFLKRIIKKYYNQQLIRGGYNYTEYFGSVSDFRVCNEMVGDNLEIMVHPDYNEFNELIDRDPNSLYESPYGEKMKEIIEAFNVKGTEVYIKE